MSGSVRKEFPTVARSLILGALALMGGTLALAQVAAPPAQPNRTEQNAQNAQTQPGAQNRAQPGIAQDRAGQRATGQADRQAQPGRQADQDRQGAQRQPADPRTRPADRDAQDRQADRGQRQDSRRGAREGREAPQRGQRQGLGIQFDQQARDGLTISNVQQESLAAEAGLKAGDRIVSVDGRQITGPRQFQAYLSGQYGREVPVVVMREGQQQTIHLSPGSQGDNVAWLGVFLNDNVDDQRGAMVMQVYPAGPAARAGLWPRDVITHVNGQEVAGSADLIAVIEEQEPGSKAEFNVKRNNQELKVTATLGSRDHFIFHGRGEDFGRGEFGRGEFGRGGSSGQDDEFSNIPPHAMQLEHDRRMAEQHERLENQMAKLTEEVRQLRELIQQQQRR